MRDYLQSIEHAAPGASIRVMTSAGGLKPTQEFQPVDGLLSGPAGGVIGAQIGTQAGVRLRGEQLRILLAILVLAVSVKIGLELVIRPGELYGISTNLD